MSDYNNPNNFDKYGNPLPNAGTPYEPVESNGRGPYVLLGLLVLVAIVGGALYFNGTPTATRRGADVAAAPPITDTRAAPTAPTAPTGPVNTTPAPTATPAPAGPPSTTQQ